MFFTTRNVNCVNSEYSSINKSTNFTKTKHQTKILIIDDDVDVVESAQLLLNLIGYNIQSAFSGIQGLEKFEEFHPDITFLDVKMPGMDGYDTFFSIRARYPDAKIVFLSGEDYTGEKYKKIKELDILTLKKPIWKEKWIDTISDLLEC